MNDDTGYEDLYCVLSTLYSPETARRSASRLLEVIAAYAHMSRTVPGTCGWDQGDVVLITYPDTLVSNDTPALQVLDSFMQRFAGADISFVHVLPFFPSTSDKGFAVVDYRRLDAAYGSWAHIDALAQRYRLVFDAVINHVSASSVYMQRLRHAAAGAPHFFIEPPDTFDMSRVVRPRSSPLVHEYATPHGKKRLWTTFSEDQIDLDYHNPDVLVELIDVLLYYAYHGAAMIRLDAIGYIWKESGTSCINLPGAHAIVRLIRLVYKMAAPHVLVLTETNVPHRENVAYFGNGTNEAHIVYNFTLSPLILHALLAGNAEVLTAWAASVDAPPAGTTFLNFTASHDGIGIRPTEGILDDAQRAYLCELTRRHGGRIGYKRESDGTDTPYELNITYFDAINDPCADESLQHQVRRFMVSQAIMLAFRGIPALYIHSLFGTRNAHEEVARTGIARSINRAQRDYEDLSRLLTTPHTREYLVYRGVKRLLDARKRVPAFHPDATQRVHRLHERVFALQRTHPHNGHTVLALHNVSSETVSVDAARVPAAFARCRDVFTARTVLPHKDGGVILPPYGISWLAAGE